MLSIQIILEANMSDFSLCCWREGLNESFHSWGMRCSGERDEWLSGVGQKGEEMILT